MFLRPLFKTTHFRAWGLVFVNPTSVKFPFSEPLTAQSCLMYRIHGGRLRHSGYPTFWTFPRFWTTGRWGNYKEKAKTQNWRVTSRVLFLSQNLSEIPPRTERRPVLSCVSISPFSILAWTSSRLRASRTASARTGKPKLGSSCVIWMLNDGS
jgi:hypothetical protein